MADSYIDQEETQIYGPHASRKIKRDVVGLIPKCDGALNYVADELDEATGEVKRVVRGARRAKSEVHKGAQTKKPALEQALDGLRRFGKHLDTHKKGTVYRKRFFTADGTVGGVGRSATVEGVLRLAGKVDLMPRIFHDLAVPAGAKVTAPPEGEGKPPVK